MNLKGILMIDDEEDLFSPAEAYPQEEGPGFAHAA